MQNDFTAALPPATENVKLFCRWLAPCSICSLVCAYAVAVLAVLHLKYFLSVGVSSLAVRRPQKGEREVWLCGVFLFWFVCCFFVLVFFFQPSQCPRVYFYFPCNPEGTGVTSCPVFSLRVLRKFPKLRNETLLVVKVLSNFLTMCTGWKSLRKFSLLHPFL